MPSVCACPPPALRGRPARLPLLAVAAAILGTGCTTVGDSVISARVDYRTEGARTAPTLDVPPDLTQLSKDLRYQPPSSGSVSATALQSAAATAAGARADAAATEGQNVAPRSAGDLRIERAGSQRWLATKASPEQLWPQLREFWQENGFVLESDKPDVGIMETNWAENRAKLPQDMIRRTIGRVFESLYDSGERDRFRTRLERTPAGTEIFISHRGMAEVVAGVIGTSDTTRWQVRPADPELEVEMLTRLMLKLSGKTALVKAPAPGASAPAAAASAVATTTPEVTAPARARLLEGRNTPTLQVDDAFDRAWRRVGLALDRSGFTVEDRDRNAGTYYVRYVDPKYAGQEEPGFFSRLFGAKSTTGGADRYRVVVKGEGGNASTVTVLDSLGAPLNGEATQRIAELLLGDLR